MLFKLGDFLYDLGDKYLKFLFDWLGVTKKQACLAHFLAFCVSQFVFYFLLKMMWLNILNFPFDVFLLIGIVMGAQLPKHPKNVSTMTIIFIASSIIVLLLHVPYAYLAATSFFNFIVFSVTASSTNDGERGKKAKMAWSKIKELFGTSWVSDPVQIPS